MYLPEMLYKYKPYLIILIGGLVIYGLEHPIGNIGGALLIIAGAIIYRMRTERA